MLKAQSKKMKDLVVAIIYILITYYWLERKAYTY